MRTSCRDIRPRQDPDGAAGPEGLSPQATVKALRQARVVASVAPCATPHVRLAPRIQNTAAEVESAIAALPRL